MCRTMGAPRMESRRRRQKCLYVSGLIGFNRGFIDPALAEARCGGSVPRKTLSQKLAHPRPGKRMRRNVLIREELQNRSFGGCGGSEHVPRLEQQTSKMDY